LLERRIVEQDGGRFTPQFQRDALHPGGAGAHDRLANGNRASERYLGNVGIAHEFGPDDITPDAHLRAALRHAPDATLQAPPAVSARVLAAARDAVRTDERDRRRSRWRWWAPRSLGASGTFATLLLAGVIGLLWRGETPPAVETKGTNAPAADQSAAPAAPPPISASSAPPAARAEAPARLSKRLREAAPNAVAKLEPSAPATSAELQGANTAAPTAKSADATTAAAPEAAVPASPPAVAERRAEAAPQASKGQLAPAAPAPTSLAFKPWPEGTMLSQRDAQSAPVLLNAAAWLAELARLTDGRWHAVDEQVLPGAARVAILRGPLQARVTIGERRIQWCEPSPALHCHAAELGVDESRRLREALQR